MCTVRITRTLFFLAFLSASSIHPILSQGIEKAIESIHSQKDQPTSIPRDSVLVHNYNYLAEAYSGKQDSLALLYIDSISQLLKSTKWPKAQGLYHRAVGKYHDRRGEFQNALEAYTLALESFSEADDVSAYTAYAGILKAFVLNNNGLPDECETELEKVRPIAEKLENKNYLAWIIDAFGDHYFYSGFGKQDINKALGYYQQVEAILPQVRHNGIIADNAHCLSGCYLRLGQEEQALKYRDIALAIAEKNGMQNIIFAVYGDLADVYEEQGKFEDALKYRTLSLESARKAQWIEMESRAENTMANTFKQAGDFEQALAHFERYKEIEDSLARFEVQSQYAELQTRYEADRKDLEIERLKASQLTFIRNALLLLLLCGIGFFIYYSRVNKKLRRQNVELQDKNQEIQMALTEGQNLERKRMAIDLHDNINAKIAATKWMLETLSSEDKSEKERKLIDSLIHSVTEIYEDVRFISHNLVPKELESNSLETVVSQLIQNLNQNQKIQFTFDMKGSAIDLNDSIKMHSYSVIMELINNIIRHSGCQNASVSLAYTSNSVDLNVCDDGSGFDPEMVASGTGLNNTRARVQSLDGTMTVSPNMPNGTQINISIPLTAKHKAKAAI